MSLVRQMKRTRLARLVRLVRLQCLSVTDCIRLNYSPRYREMLVRLHGKNTRLTDAASFVYGLEEVFGKRAYDFCCANKAPRVIDAGANVGLAPMFWRLRWSTLDLTCFEPDPVICGVLKHNLSSHGINQAQVYQCALATHSGEKIFRSEGGTSGRLDPTGDIKVKTLKLSDFLDRPVDLLKVDIEGEETEVLLACGELLKSAQNIFIEYHSFERKPQELHELLTLLHRCNFRYYTHTEFCSTTPFKRITTNDTMDYQVSIFALKE
jgi:FkbM family methyltransferase